MASLERIVFHEVDASHLSSATSEMPLPMPGRGDARLPVIVWASGDTWGQANLWALDLRTRLDHKTVESKMKHLAAYAQWLETEKIDWWAFPDNKEQRCVYAFRRALITARDAGAIAPSTATARMSAVQGFYLWAHKCGLIETQGEMWKSREVAITKTNSFGLDRTIRVLTTDLAIPCRKVKGGFHLEDGVMPVTSEAYRAILDFSETQPNEELSLMLALGFGTGLRIGSIVDLKVDTIEKATIDPFTNWRCIEVGPAARPRVSTKMDMSGKVPFVVDSLRTRTLEYAKSTRRLLRQSMARKEHRCLLFLNEDGAPFNQGSVTTAMCRLRAKALAQGRTEFRGFYFHRSRATFATLLMRAALGALSVSDAIDLVREACLHSSAATTLEYVKFIEQSTSMREHADAFTSAFLGLNKRDSRNA